MESKSDWDARARTAFAEGDREQYGALVFEYLESNRPWLGQKYLKFPDHVDDAIAESTRKALEFESIEQIQDFGAYLKRMVEHDVLSRIKRGNRELEMPEDEDGAPIEPVDLSGFADPRERLLVEQYTGALRSLDLGEICRMVNAQLRKKDELGMYLLAARAESPAPSFSDIAGRLGEPDTPRTWGRYRTRMSRAKKKYAELLAVELKKRAGDDVETSIDAMRHYLDNIDQYASVFE